MGNPYRVFLRIMAMFHPVTQFYWVLFTGNSYGVRTYRPQRGHLFIEHKIISPRTTHRSRTFVASIQFYKLTDCDLMAGFPAIRSL